MISRFFSLNLTPVVFRQMLKLSDAQIFRLYTGKYVRKLVFYFYSMENLREAGTFYTRCL